MYLKLTESGTIEFFLSFIFMDFFFFLKQDCPPQLMELCLLWAEASAFIALRTEVWVTKAKDARQGLGGKRAMD